MFNSGNILFCKNFQFNNNNTPKDKYFIVLKRHQDKLILGSLPTRTSKMVNFIDVEHGCVNINERCFNCYVFEANKVICDNGFSFPIKTFIYGDELDLYDVDIVEANYQLNVTYNLQGTLKLEEYDAILNCIITSDSVKKKYIRLLK